MMRFTHLHVHSHYSLLDGLAKIDQILDACQELKMSSIALTDHGSMYGLVEFYQKAKKRGIRPILGSEMYLAPNGMLQKRPNIDKQRYHLLLLVKNAEGYRNLVKLTTKAHLEGFYYKPRIDKEILKKHSQGLIASSACLSGEIPRKILSGEREVAEKTALEYQEIFGKGNFYLELQHHPNIPEQAIVNKGIIEIAKKYSIPLIATNDVHYIKPEDAEAQDILMRIQTDKSIKDETRSMKSDDFSLRPTEQMIEDFKDVPEAIENTQKIASQCNFEFELGKLQLPYYEVPAGQTPYEFLEKSCRERIPQRYGANPDPEVFARLEHELDVIKKIGFASYFLIVQDFVSWAKSQKIGTGPGRGSAAGSIVSYLLEITEIDPLKYNLLFERFLNPGRTTSMPDIDLDFADDRRDEVIGYVSKKYGRNQVAQIITFGTMAARAAIRDVGRVLDYSYNFCDQVAKMIPPGLSLERAIHESQELHKSYESDENVKRLIDMSMKLEGCARHVSTHAAGVVITKDDIDNLVPRQHPTQDQEAIVTQYEMHAVEDLGLLKMDFLGLKTLTVIQNTASLIKKSQQKEVNLSNAPLDDLETFKLFQEANTTGVFQLESSGMKRYLKLLQPTQFEDIIAMVALYRPGPMEFIPEFIARKKGLKKVKYLHPDLKPILENTYGICVYQEQLMLIAQDLAGFSPIEADVLRKAVGKKIKKLLDEQRDKMIEGMVKNQIERKVAEEIWSTVEPFARYGFNRAHSCCYATIGYWTAYLKAHYPAEFMAALMTSEQNDIERIAFLVDACNQINIKVAPPHINESEQNFTTAGKGVIRFGLNAIKNVGHNVVDSIVEERKKNGPFKSITDFIERVESKDLNKKSLESLIKCGALDIFGERNQLLLSLDQILGLAREIQKARNSGQVSLFGSQTQVEVPSLRMAEVTPASQKDCLSWEKELVGLYISEHPLKKWQKELGSSVTSCRALAKSPRSRSHRVKISCIINKVQRANTRAGQPMLFVEVEDTTGRAEVLVFPKVLEQTSTAWQEEKIIVVSGKLSDRDENLKILCDNVKILE